MSFTIILAFQFAHGKNKPKVNSPSKGPPIIPNKPREAYKCTV